MNAADKPGTEPAGREGVRNILRSPYWWFRDVAVALIIGGLLAVGTIIGEKLVDDRRAEREVEKAIDTNRYDLQLENLRYVRDHAYDQPDGTRRFAELDLAGQNLVGLPLTGSDFAVADLAGANLSESDLSRSNFARANLRGADLARALFRGAYFGVERIPDATNRNGADLTDADLSWADFTDADLSHATLTGAQMNGTILTNVFYDADTVWPTGFTPPPSRQRR